MDWDEVGKSVRDMHADLTSEEWRAQFLGTWPADERADTLLVLDNAASVRAINQRSKRFAAVMPFAMETSGRYDRVIVQIEPGKRPEIDGWLNQVVRHAVRPGGQIDWVFGEPERK